MVSVAITGGTGTIVCAQWVKQGPVWLLTGITLETGPGPGPDGLPINRAAIHSLAETAQTIVRIITSPGDTVERNRQLATIGQPPLIHQVRLPAHANATGEQVAIGSFTRLSATGATITIRTPGTTWWVTLEQSGGVWRARSVDNSVCRRTQACELIAP